ncbi:MAG: VanW family protein [Actinomycetota bacterium]
MAALSFHSIVAFAAADASLNQGRIHYGVKIYEADVSRFTKTKAKDEIKQKVERASHKDLKVIDKNKSWLVEAKFLKAKSNGDSAVRKAYATGRTGNLLSMLVVRARLYIKPMSVVVPSKVSEEYLKVTVAKIAEEVDKPAANATVIIEGEKATVRKSKNGWVVRRGRLASDIRTHAADFYSRKIGLPQGVDYVTVHNADAEEARLIALEMIREPIDYTINGKDYTIGPAKIGTLIEFIPEKKTVKKDGRKVKDTVLTPELTRRRLEQYFIPLKTEFETKPVDARFEAGSGTVTIIPGQNGLVIDMDAAVVDLNKLALAEPPRKATLKMKELEPALTTAKAEAMGIKERVSVHTEYFDYTPNRSKNIRTLAESLDGKIVAPGQVWSINEATGPRTTTKGYTEAPVIINGQLSPDVGGGICNVSTTIFNTVFFGGYEVIERYPHDFYISHYPDGRDASIYYDGGMDFKFKNDTPHYILIKTDHSETSVTIAFYSTNMGTEVSYSNMGFLNIVPYGIVYKDDPAVPTGWEKDADMGYGVDGRDITVFRTVKRSGAVVREEKFFSHYEPKQRIVLKGTGPPLVLPPGTPSPPDLRPFGLTPR